MGKNGMPGFDTGSDNGLFTRWVQQLLGGALPQETRATCFDCAMGRDKACWETESDTYFDVNLKCCTYTPPLANFLVGLILMSETPEMAFGRSVLESQIRMRQNITPHGILPPVDQQGNPAGFGRDPGLLCPYYIRSTGLCGIWQYRNSACTTFFCKPVRASIGMKFWKCVRDFLLALEKFLAEWCLQQLSPDYGWKQWMDREMEFYMACGKLVGIMQWNDVAAIAPPEIKVLGRQLCFAYGLLKWNPLPPRLVQAQFKRMEEGVEEIRIWTYSENDPVDLNKNLFRALAYFQGRSVSEAVDLIRREAGILIDNALLQKLVDHRVLVGA